MKKLVRVGGLKVGEEFETQGGATLVVKDKGENCVIASTVLGATYNTALPGDTKVFIALADEDYERDYSLLRPLDPAKLKQGDNVLHLQGEREVTYIAGPDEAGGIVVRDSGDRLRLRQARWYRMKPLFWLEGRPVYEGDKLFSPKGVEVQVLRIGIKTPSDPLGMRDSVEVQLAADGRTAVLDQYKLHWTKPKVKKEGWVNIYGINRCSSMYETKAEADGKSDKYRKACVRVEWEE